MIAEELYDVWRKSGERYWGELTGDEVRRWTAVAEHAREHANEEFKRGYNDGREEGISEGWDQGYDEGREEG